MREVTSGWAVKAIVVIVLASLFYICFSATSLTVGDKAGWGLITSRRLPPRFTQASSSSVFIFKLVVVDLFLRGTIYPCFRSVEIEIYMPILPLPLLGLSLMILSYRERSREHLGSKGAFGKPKDPRQNLTQLEQVAKKAGETIFWLSPEASSSGFLEGFLQEDPISIRLYLISRNQVLQRVRRFGRFGSQKKQSSNDRLLEELGMLGEQTLCTETVLE